MAKPTLLDAFESSNLVITARLASVEKIREKERKYDVGYIRSAISMIVDKVYKGDVKPGAALKFGQVWCRHVFDFRRRVDRTTVLFYVGSPTRAALSVREWHPATVWPKEGGQPTEPMYHAVHCGRSNGLRSAHDDLAYLDNMAKAKGRTRLSGNF
jgi:hypothetical protein